MLNSKFDPSFDFGFSLVDEDQIETQAQRNLANQSNEHREMFIDAKQKLTYLYNMIMPLLNNLKKDPDKEYILWPDRVKKIDAFISKIDDLVKEDAHP